MDGFFNIKKMPPNHQNTKCHQNTTNGNFLGKAFYFSNGPLGYSLKLFGYPNHHNPLRRDCCTEFICRRTQFNLSP